jgi:hypothetical protein
VIVSERALPEHGGVAVATSRIAAQAHSRGERVHVISLSREVAPGARHAHERAGVTYHSLGRLPREDDAAMALADHARDIIAEAGADLVHGRRACAFSCPPSRISRAAAPRACS